MSLTTARLPYFLSFNVSSDRVTQRDRVSNRVTAVFMSSGLSLQPVENSDVDMNPKMRLRTGDSKPETPTEGDGEDKERATVDVVGEGQ